MKVAVTGATGHVGTCLIQQLLEKKYEVRVLIHHHPGNLQNLPVETVTGSLQEEKALKQLCDDREVIFHLAAKISIGNDKEETVFQTNVTGTQKLAAIARNSGVKKFIHFSSVHTLQSFPYNKPLDESRPLVLGASLIYEKTKAQAEQWILKQNAPDFQVIVLNPTAIIGPCDTRPSYLGRVIQRIYKGTLPGLVPGGYNWVDVRDVATAAIAAAEKGHPGERYLLSGTWKSLQELAEIICAHRNKKCHLPVFPFWLAHATVPLTTFLARLFHQEPLYTRTSLTILKNAHPNISPEKACRELGFSPRPLEETLADTINWFKKHQYI